MAKISAFKHSEWTLKRKLFVYMLLLAVLLLFILASCLILFGRTNNTAEIYYESLTTQMEIFEKDVSSHFDHLAASAISLSENMTSILEDTLSEQNISFYQLTDSKDSIAALQSAMIEPLRQKLLQTNCSGAFLMLNATVNSSLAQSAHSKTGLYLQTSGYLHSDSEVLLYRGNSDIALAKGITPHRKWRLEFRTDLFPDYAKLISDAAHPLNTAYRITSPFTLPGTSEQVLLLTIPMLSKDGTFYGICGYEISASYFMTHHTQPSRLAHLSCLLATAHDNVLISKQAMYCGGADGYFHSLTEDYAIQKGNHGFSVFTDDIFSYIGVTKKVSLSSDESQQLLVTMIPKTDYDRARLKSFAQTCGLLVLLLFFTVSFCRFFSRRFLSPILTALEQIKSNKRASSDIPEILDLIAYLDKQEKEHGEALDALEKKHQVSEAEKLRLQQEYESALSSFRKTELEYEKAQEELLRVQKKIEHLAYSRKAEIDPADYAYFLSGLQTLTKAERNLFELYLAGKSAAEILELMGIKESTLKYHNHNLLGKLGVTSRKQMLRYAEIMRQQNEDENKPANHSTVF
ncbi:MAG: hypothetical protein E7491_02745 [Ruminococcaceae bacterium]|nr:hypothetical protein [Oscillospiraceae bacterium]